MKKALLILILILPMACEASFGWRFKDFSLLAGQQYSFGQRPLTAFELQYDRFSTSCVQHKNYFGIGAGYAFNYYNRELGLKVMLNPGRSGSALSHSIKMHPYFFGQGNMIQTVAPYTTPTLDNLTNQFGFRPGVGLTGNFRDHQAISIRVYLQLGYNLLMNQILPIKNAITLEFKVGIGIDGRLVMSN